MRAHDSHSLIQQASRPEQQQKIYFYLKRKYQQRKKTDKCLTEETGKTYSHIRINVSVRFSFIFNLCAALTGDRATSWALPLA